MSVIDKIPYIQNSPSSKIFNTSENLLDFFSPQKVNDAGIVNVINSYEIDQSEFLKDKMLEKTKLKTIILKSITERIEFWIKNKLLRNKPILVEKSSYEMYRKKINMLREEIKGKNFIIKDLL